MFQFGEILCLCIALLTGVYLVSNWRRIQTLPVLRALVGPFLLMAVAWIATVAEGVFLNAPNLPLLVLGQEVTNNDQVHAVGSQVLNLIEHASLAGAGVWLLVVMRRLPAASKGASP